MEMEIPYSPELVRAFWLAAGGSILAAEQALKDRIALNIGGGFHHAFSNHGEGFCMINDVAVAIRRMQRDEQNSHRHDGGLRRPPGQRYGSDFCRSAHAQRSAAFDFSARTGFGIRRRVPAKCAMPIRAMSFTISLHQHNNYPAWKPPSSIDVDLPDGIGDDDYLAWLDNALSSGLRQFEPDLICYIAGADPYREDQLGGLALTMEGLKRRDELVFRVAKARNIPVMVTYAGGYARKLEDTVTIHCNTVIAAAEVFSPSKAA